ncbi:DBH-like monooxygenase protein 1 [Artemia franciscana]
MNGIKIFITFGFLFLTFATALAVPHENNGRYLHEQDISSTGAFIARWTPDVENNKIHFEFEAQTLGWVGVSILRQTTEGQIGDQVIAGVYEDGTSYIQDRYFNTSIPHPERPLRPIDVQQDWVLRYAEERNDKTIVGVSRPLDTGDLYDGPVIEDIVLKLSWAYDELDIIDGVAPDHGPTFGAVYVNFLNPEV